MNQLIEKILLKFANDLHTGNTNITEDESYKILTVLSTIGDKDQRMSKIKSCDYLGISRSAFDKLVREGFIPKGRKDEGFNELSWSKVDLDMYKLKYGRE